MRLKAEQIQQHLKQATLKPIYLIVGDEPLQCFETLDAIRQQARTQGYEERVVLQVDKQFNWQSLLDEAAALSLFASQKIIELKLAGFKPGRDGGKALQHYADELPAGCLLLISADKLDKSAQNTKWFKALDSVGASVLIWPLELRQLPGWISQRARGHGKSIDRDAAEMIAARVEGNLMAASQELAKLCLLVDADQIRLADVADAVVDSSRYDVFKLMESAYIGDTQRTARMLRGLQSEGLELMAIYGALMWEFRRLCKMAFKYRQQQRLDALFSEYKVWNDGRKRALEQVLRRHPLASLHGLLSRAVVLDRSIKSADRSNAWNELLQLLTLLAQAPRPAS